MELADIFKYEVIYGTQKNEMKKKSKKNRRAANVVGLKAEVVGACR
jgi:hypothetical protein